MPWFKVDDNIHSHPKARRAGLAAMGLWSLAGSHCMDYLTDGVVETWFVESWPDGSKLAARLVAVGLWDTHPEGFAFHDWAEYQPTAEQLKAEREAAKERMRAVRANRKANVRPNVPANEHELFGARSASPVPVPSPDSSKTSESQSRDTRASVSTDSMEIPETTRRMAARKGITSLRTVADSIQRHTGLRVDAHGAYQVAASLLEKAKDHPKAPGRYVSAAIERSPLEVQQFIHENALEVA